jgi:phosphoglycerate kinase
VNSIFNFSISKKTVFLRVDFNVPIQNNVIVDAKRIDEIIPTILC